jgi:hypothetical protein
MGDARVGPPEGGPGAIPAPTVHAAAFERHVASTPSTFHTGIWSGYVRRYFAGQFFDTTQQIRE